MAKHTFVTASHTTYDETRTVEILSRTDVSTIASKVVEEAASGLMRSLSAQNRKLDKAAEQAKAAAKDAAEAKESVERLVETARETFRDVIAEMLEPHYRVLAEHLGVKSPIQTAKPKIAKSAKSASMKAAKSTTGKKSKTLRNTLAPSKKTTPSSRTKGAQPCRKK